MFHMCSMPLFGMEVVRCLLRLKAKNEIDALIFL